MKKEKNKKIKSILLYLAILGGVILGLKMAFDTMESLIYPKQKIHIVNTQQTHKYQKLPSQNHMRE